MIIYDNPSELQKYILRLKRDSKIISFVPTMGYLHEGHLSLIRQAKASSDFAVVSIFVNPLQFGPTEDLDKYPRSLERDKNLAESAGCDILFFPTPKTMYPDNFSCYAEETLLSQNWCGVKRKGHFKGVTTVVLKLFNIVQPDKTYFGEKDIQQALIIKKMISDFNLPIDLIIAPIVREPDGLAMSSRNVYLTPHQRIDAALLKKSLNEAVNIFQSGINSSSIIIKTIHDIILKSEFAKIDYMACVDGNTLLEKNCLQKGDRILIAVYIGTTRLIDNIQL